MRAIVKAIPAALLFRVSQAKASDNRASDKMTRRQACKVVEGEISKDGWCKAFAMAD